ncbi:hypothetical protein VKT23_014913 [Stygiomarasmius scandens]|uniref:Uncharacterized protein n=1 Tax=Marasmiellus scandens TaxID=2682957 RepID=A0ABR1J2U1_9AGAR
MSDEPTPSQMESNPYLETCLDFADSLWDAVRLAVSEKNNISDEEACTILKETWLTRHKSCLAQWDAQVDADEEEVARLEVLQKADEEEALRQADLRAEQERVEAEKKKLKIADFEEGKLAPDFIAPHASAFALKKAADKEYCELWYYTAEGYQHTAKCSSNVSSTDGYTITGSGNNSFTLQPAVAHNSSKSCRPDEQLSFSKMSSAKSGWIEDITKANWPPKHVLALTRFFYNIENHPICWQCHGEAILARYQARIRKEWFMAFKNGQGWDIGIMNESLLSKIKEEYQDSLMEQKFRLHDGHSGVFIQR